MGKRAKRAGRHVKKLDMQGASWDSFFLISVKFLTVFTSMALTKLLSAGLSLKEYGTYSQANIVVSVGTSVLLLGLGDALNYYYNNKSQQYDRSDRIAFVNTVFLIEMIAGIVFAAAVMLGRGALSGYFSNNALQSLLIIISVKPMLDNLNYFYQVLYISAGKAKAIAARNLVLSLAKLAIIYMTVHVLHSVNLIFIALIALDLVQLVLFKTFFVRYGFLVNPLKGARRCVMPILKYGIPMGVYALTNMLTREVDKLVIGRLADTETLAVYSNCSKILPFDIVAVSFATILVPYIMSNITANNRESSLLLFQNYMKIGYYSAWILGAAVFITNEQVICFLYTEDYLAGKMVFLLYIADSMIRFASMHLILTASGNSKALMMYSVVALVLNLVLNLAFFQLWGMVGPAAATALTAVLYTILVLRKTLQVLKAGWSEIFDLKDLALFVSVLAVTGIWGYFLNKGLLHMGMPGVMAMLVTAALYGCMNLGINFKRIMRSIKLINSLKM